MTCNEIRDLMPDLAAGLVEATPDVSGHLQTCAGCAEKLKEFRQTMTLLDEWKAPEPTPYFDVRLQARLREEMQHAPSGWMQWFRRPVLAVALTVLLGVGIAMFFTRTAAGSSLAATTMWQPRMFSLARQSLERRLAICRPWIETTSYMPTSSCWTIWKYNTM